MNLIVLLINFMLQFSHFQSHEFLSLLVPAKDFTFLAHLFYMF